MKDKMLRIRVDSDFLSKLDYLKRIHGFRTIAETVRRIVEKEYRKETQDETDLSLSRPHGHWIKHHESRAGIVYSCDRCGRTLQALSWETRKDVYKMYPFCHCGADMRQ